MDESFAEFKRLIEEIPKDHPLGGSIELLLAQMDPESARQLKLSAIPHYFNLDVLQALNPRIDVSTAQQQFAEFSELSIVIGHQQGYSLHDDARRYLFDKWLQSDQHQEFVSASARLVEYYNQCQMTTSGEAWEACERSRMFHLLGVDPAQGFEEFERLFRHRRHQFLLDECESLIKLVQEYKDVLGEDFSARLTYHDAKLAADLRQLSRAEANFKSLLEKPRLNPKLRVKTYNRLGLMNTELRDWPSAIEFFRQGLQQAKVLGNSPELIYRNLHDLGVAYRDSGNLTEANQLLNDSLQLAEKNGDDAALATGYNSLGILYQKIGHLPQATEAYKKSLGYLERSEDRFRSAQVYNNLGVTYLDLQDWPMSRQYFERSLEIKRKAGDTLGQAMTLNNLVQVYQHQKQYHEASQASRQAIQKFTEMHDLHSVALAERTLAKLYHDMKQPDPARQAFEKAIELFILCDEPGEAEATRKELKQLRRRSPWIRRLLIGGAAVVLILLAGIIGLVLILKESGEQVSLGDRLQEQGKYKAAIAAYQKAIEQNPENYLAYNNRGVSHFFLKAYQQALSDYTKALELHQQDPTVYINRGDVNRVLLKYDNALADYNQALELDPEFPIAYNNRGNVYLMQNRLQKALADYSRAIELNPQNHVIYVNRGLVYLNLNQRQQAIAEFNHAIKIQPQAFEAYRQRGYAYFALQQFDRALGDFTRAIEMNPGNDVIYNDRGFVYWNLKQDQNAVQDYSRAIEINPQTDLYFNNRGLAHFYLQNYDEALNDLDQAIKISPDFANPYNHRGLVYMQLKQFQQAQTDFSTAIEKNQTYAAAYGNRGWVRHLQGNLQEAKKDYLKQVSLEKEKTSYPLVLLGILTWQGDQFEAARRYFEQGLRLASEEEKNPYYRNYLHRMAVCRLGVGQTESGLDIYRHMAKEAPSYQIQEAVLALEFLLGSQAPLDGVKQAIEILETAKAR